MSRTEEILKYIDRNQLGLEVAPYFNPIAPKREGNNILILDVFDTDTLRSRAKQDPFIPDERIEEIEPVDIVGSATEIAELLDNRGLRGRLGYIISSHNFEHLPNPIKFLQGCYDALQPGGILSMATPDYRACFDHFRFPTNLSDWLEAYFENRTQPTPKQIFDNNSLRAYYHPDGSGQPIAGCTLTHDTPEYFKPDETVDVCLEKWRDAIENPSNEYIDVHCSAFFNHSFELLIRDLRHLGMVKFEILEISEPSGIEFFIHLKKGNADKVRDDDFYGRRHALLRKINQSLGWAGFDAWKQTLRGKDGAKYPSSNVIVHPGLARSRDLPDFVAPRQRKKTILQRIKKEARRFKDTLRRAIYGN